MELDKERLNELNVKVQEFLFLKASQQEVSSYLITHVIKHLLILECDFRHFIRKFIFLSRV